MTESFGLCLQPQMTLGPAALTRQSTMFIGAVVTAQERSSVVCSTLGARAAQASITSSMGRPLGLVGGLLQAVAVGQDVLARYADH